jgi:hypothetical protein
METATRNLEQILIDRNGALTAALVRIRALADERRADRDFAFIFQMAEDTIAQAGAPAATIITASFRRWHELWNATISTDAASAAASKERHAIALHIIGSRAGCLPDVLAKVRILREMETGGEWIAEDAMLASIAADLEHLATAGAS